MEELSIEEKARRYDEAIKVAKSNYETIVQMDEGYTFAKEWIVNTFHHMFPELKENKDENIRKWLIERVEEIRKANPTNADHNGKCSEAIAWIEKQDKSNMGISEATKKKLEDNLNKALQKETPESCNEFLEEQNKKKPAKQPQSHKLDEEIEEWLGCEAFPEGTNITPLPKAIEIVRKTINHFYNFGRKQQAIRNIQHTDLQVITPESHINEGKKKGIQIVLDNPQEYGLQKIAKWSEEDETKIKSIIVLLKSPTLCTMEGNKGIIAANIKYLNSLKERIGNFDDGYKAGFSAAKHNQWKPSDEQITWLYRATDEAKKDSRMKQVLNELLSELKELKGE